MTNEIVINILSTLKDRRKDNLIVVKEV